MQPASSFERRFGLGFWHRRIVFQPSKWPVHRDVHGNKAGQSAHQLRDSLCGKHARSPHPNWQNDGQRSVDDRLAKQREEYRLFGSAQTGKDILSGHLQRHWDKQGK